MCDWTKCDREGRRVFKVGMFFAEYCDDHYREAEVERKRAKDRENESFMRNHGRRR